MEYCLDAGDGTASIWTGPAALDLDGDGLFDDVLADLDDDGMADHADLDLDDDGRAEARYTDDGSGAWMVGGIGTAGPLRWFGLDGVEHAGIDTATDYPDVDGDGVQDRLLDMNRDGLADRALRTDGGSATGYTDGRSTTGYIDTDGDGRWDVMLADTDGDGSADGAGVL
jgi:hypothetical protein